MYIVNANDVKNTATFGKGMSNYLIKCGFHLVSSSDDKYYFKKTEELEESYNKAPFYLKLLERW